MVQTLVTLIKGKIYRPVPLCLFWGPVFYVPVELNTNTAIYHSTFVRGYGHVPKYIMQAASKIYNLVREEGDKGIVLHTTEDQLLGQTAAAASGCETSLYSHPGMKSRVCAELKHRL